MTAVSLIKAPPRLNSQTRLIKINSSLIALAAQACANSVAK